MKPVSISEQELSRIPFFKGVARKLKRFIEEKDIVALMFDPGEIICKEGEYAYTAFYILEGVASAAILNTVVTAAESTETVEKSHSGLKISFKRKPAKSATAEQPAERIVPIDLEKDISYSTLSVELTEGDLIGEAASLNRYPRSTTVVAKTAVTVIEFTGWVLRQVKDTEDFLEHMNKKYLLGAFQTHIRNVPLFSVLSRDELDYLVKHVSERVEFANYKPGEQIVEEGTPGDFFYLMRGGHIKIAQKRGVGEVTLAYLSRGSYFGEMALLTNKPRGASVYALDHVEIVKISKNDFVGILHKFPAVRQKLEADMTQRAHQTEKLSLNLANLWLTDVAMKQGIAEGEDLLIMDLNLCTRCDNCVAACAAIHDGQTRLLRKGQKLGHFLIPTSCRQCSDPMCMIGCPVSAVVRDMQTGEVHINDRCIGCGHCSHQCPYGNIIMVTLHGKAAEQAPALQQEVVQAGGVTSHGVRVRESSAPALPQQFQKARRKATKCDLCKGLPYAACVNNCPHGAALRINSRHFLKYLAEKYGGS